MHFTGAEDFRLACQNLAFFFPSLAPSSASASSWAAAERLRLSLCDVQGCVSLSTGMGWDVIG